MSSYRQIIYHIIFSTKFRRWAINREHKHELYNYMATIIKNKNCKAHQINGVEDHVHILCDLHPSIALADLVKDIKVASSLWMKQSGKFPGFVGWGEGYGAFTYTYRDKDMISKYIQRQEVHHLRNNFEKEYIKMLRDSGIEFDEKYVFT